MAWQGLVRQGVLGQGVVGLVFFMDYREKLIALGIEAERVDAFIAFHKEHLDIWKEFEAISLKLAETGAQKWGGMAVLNVIRWQRHMEKRGEFKVSNNWEPFYVRTFDLKYPHLNHLFEKHAMKKAA